MERCVKKSVDAPSAHTLCGGSLSWYEVRLFYLMVNSELVEAYLHTKFRLYVYHPEVFVK